MPMSAALRPSHLPSHSSQLPARCSARSPFMVLTTVPGGRRSRSAARAIGASTGIVARGRGAGLRHVDDDRLLLSEMVEHDLQRRLAHDAALLASDIGQHGLHYEFLVDMHEADLEKVDCEH